MATPDPARDAFIVENLPLVHSRVRWLNGGVFDEDMAQEGSLALILAADRFRPEMGYAFSTFAVRYIDGFILKYRRHNAIIKPKRRGNAVFYKEVAFFDDILAGDGNLTLGSTLSTGEDMEERLLSRAIVDSFTRTLTERNRLILALAQQGKRQAEIGEEVGITQSHVSRVLHQIGSAYREYAEAV